LLSVLLGKLRVLGTFVIFVASVVSFPLLVKARALTKYIAPTRDIIHVISP
jgi:hypothetical protein